MGHSIVEMVAVAAEYQPEILLGVLGTLREADINLRAYAADASGLRLFVRDPQAAKEALSGAGYFVQIVDVLSLDVDNKPGELDRVLRVLRDEELQIISGFGVAIDDTAAIFIRVDDAQRALTAIS